MRDRDAEIYADQIIELLADIEAGPFRKTDLGWQATYGFGRTITQFSGDLYLIPDPHGVRPPVKIEITQAVRERHNACIIVERALEYLKSKNFSYFNDTKLFGFSTTNGDDIAFAHSVLQHVAHRILQLSNESIDQNSLMALQPDIVSLHNAAVALRKAQPASGSPVYTF